MRFLLKDIWQHVIHWLRWKRPTPVIAPPPTKSEPLTPEPPTPEPPPTEAQPNRATRRALERARRRRDKFVVPKGPQPQPVTRKPPAPRPEPRARPEVVELVDDPNDTIIADELIEGDGQGDVLFEESELWGEFNFRDSILDQLDRYWVYLARMKKYDPDSYGFYKQFGATLIPYSTSDARSKRRKITKQERQQYTDIKLPAWFNKERPSFGCIAIGADPLTEKKELDGDDDRRTGRDSLWHPKFMYFTKYQKRKAPSTLQPMTGGDIYVMTVWWDKPQDKTLKRKWGSPQEIGIFVSADGQTIKILRILDTEMVPIKVARHLRDDVVTGRRRKGSGHAHKVSDELQRIPRRAWRIPSDYQQWAKDNGVDVQSFLGRMFANLVRDVEGSYYAMARVSVSNGDLTAVFGIDPRRMGYFFQDRDITLTSNGVKQRIFHFVAPHVRKNGTTVKAHFRGIREFDWAGYRVLVTIPGLHHIPLNEFNVGATSEDCVDKDRKYSTMPEIGKRWAKIIHGSAGGGY